MRDDEKQINKEIDWTARKLTNLIKKREKMMNDRYNGIPPRLQNFSDNPEIDQAIYAFLEQLQL